MCASTRRLASEHKTPPAMAGNEQWHGHRVFFMDLKVHPYLYLYKNKGKENIFTAYTLRHFKRQ